MDVFGRDSQLSTNLTEAVIKDSQGSNDSVFVYSQSKMENDFCQSYGSVSLTQIAKPSILQKMVRKVEKVNNNNDEEDVFNNFGDFGDTSFFNCFQLKSEAKHIGLKKRKPKMPPFLDALTLATKELDRSADTLTPVFDHSFLENSYNTTLSQQQIDSQETVQYLKKVEKEKPEAMELERVEEDEEEQKSIDVFSTHGFDYEPMNNGIDEGVDQIDGFQVEPQEEEILFDDVAVEKEVATSSTANEPIIDSVKIRIDVARITKSSDFAHELIDKNLLWARQTGPIPIFIDIEKWSKNGKRKIKLKFVRFAPEEGLDLALKDSKFAVEKCLGCINDEKRFPRDAFFYIDSMHPNYCWQPPTREDNYFCLDIDEQKHSIYFYLTFACRENCMKHPDKRGKIMVLAAVVEDELGNEICRDIFDSVRVTAYPRRDFRNYIKQKELQAEKAEMLNQINNNVTDQPTATINKQKRKRTTPYLQLGSGEPTQGDLYGPILNQQSFERYTEMPKLERNSARNEQMEVDENMESAKKSRIPMVETNGVHWTLENDDYKAVVDCLANRAKQERYQATMTKSTKASPLSYLSKVTYYTKIEDWLKTMELGHHLSYFRSQHAILAMGDLICAYKKDPYFFEKLQIPNDEKLTISRVFRNFYHVYLQDNINGSL